MIGLHQSSGNIIKTKMETVHKKKSEHTGQCYPQ